MDEKTKEQIDNMTHEQMARLWRFEPSGSKWFLGETGEYFKKRFWEHFGGITTEISKRIGWDKD